VIWLGTGENNSQRSAHFGTGLYKSTDAGKTWKNVGLEKSEHIGKNRDRSAELEHVFVAAQGPLFTEEGGGDRGLYKTTDAAPRGRARSSLMTRPASPTSCSIRRTPTSCSPGTYQRMRHVGQMIGGGPDGGVFKTIDGGKKWVKLTNGLPPGEVGRIGLAVDPEEAGPRLRVD
jgi:photosystem II stability/assembly factor-like uncharacterized protein